MQLLLLLRHGDLVLRDTIGPGAGRGQHTGHRQGIDKRFQAAIHAGTHTAGALKCATGGFTRISCNSVRTRFTEVTAGADRLRAEIRGTAGVIRIRCTALAGATAGRQQRTITTGKTTGLNACRWGEINGQYRWRATLPATESTRCFSDGLVAQHGPAKVAAGAVQPVLHIGNHAGIGGTAPGDRLASLISGKRARAGCAKITPRRCPEG